MGGRGAWRGPARENVRCHPGQCGCQRDGLLRLLLDSDGNQLSAPLVLGERKLVDWPTPSPILAVAPDGFAMLWPRPNTGWVITRIVCD